MKPSLPARWIWISALALLAACATDKDDLLPHGEQTMVDVWNGASSGPNTLSEARLQLDRPIGEGSADESKAYTRTAANELRSLFPRLPNPDLVMYVYPHLTGSEQATIPGYSTVFPFYRTVQYALPGERVEEL